MTPFIAEIIGTALLIILGGGVVANVELNKTIGKQQWMDCSNHRVGIGCICWCCCYGTL